LRKFADRSDPDYVPREPDWKLLPVMFQAMRENES